jgi:glutamate racemase
MEYIAIFDSGRGGLSVLNTINQLLPNENTIYFGDTARVPYGDKSSEIITSYTIECLDYLINFANIKLLIIACNTASANTYEILNERYQIPIIEVILPAVHSAIKTNSTNIAILGTKSTIKSKAYTIAFTKLGFNYELQTLACPLLVPLVEEGLIEGEIAELIVKKYLAMLDTRIDTIILGCTHYPFLLPTFKKLRPHINWITSNEAVALEVKKLLNQNNLTATNLPLKNYEQRMFLVTDCKEDFAIFYKRAFNSDIEVKQILLNQ